MIHSMAGDEKSEKQTLPRTMGLFSGTLVSVGMIIGSGIFSTPATILGNVGSVGMTVLIFVFAAIVSFCGVMAYIELGCMRPVSGGEKEYLDYAFPKPKALLAFCFTQCMVWLIRPGCSAADSVAFGQYMVYSIYGSKADIINNEFISHNYDQIARGFAVICILFTCTMHAYSPKWGMKIQDFLTIVKTFVLSLVVITGIVAATGLSSIKRSNNFSNFFEGTTQNGNAYASALFASFFAFDGWNNLNYSLDELIDPIVNLPKASILAISLTSFLYIAATMSYFIVVPKELINTSTSILAAQFFDLTMGKIVGKHILPAFVAFSAFGSVMCMSFGSSRVIMLAGREKFLPFSNFFGSLNSQGGPFGALVLHLVMTLIYILAPPPGPIYEFLINLTGYPEWFFYGFSVGGLLYLRYTEPDVSRPFKSWWAPNLAFIGVCIFLAVFPFVPPAKASEDGIPYFLYPLLGLIIMGLCVVWWYFQIGSKVKSEIESSEIELAAKTSRVSILSRLGVIQHAFLHPEPFEEDELVLITNK